MIGDMSPAPRPELSRWHCRGCLKGVPLAAHLRDGYCFDCLAERCRALILVNTAIYAELMRLREAIKASPEQARIVALVERDRRWPMFTGSEVP